MGSSECCLVPTLTDEVEAAIARAMNEKFEEAKLTTVAGHVNSSYRFVINCPESEREAVGKIIDQVLLEVRRTTINPSILWEAEQDNKNPSTG